MDGFLTEHNSKGVRKKEDVVNNHHECDYHACHYYGETKQCPYCNKHFCAFHAAPKIPSVMSFRETFKEIEDWRREDAHPCFAYVDAYSKMKSEEQDAIKRSMDKMKAASIKRPSQTSYAGYSSGGRWEEKPSTLKKVFWVLVFAGFLTIILAAILIPNDFRRFIFQAKDCSANLKSWDCAPIKPLYCDNGKLIDRPDICGCPNNQREWNKQCILIQNCSDGSLSPDCSQNKPFQCLNGTLMEKASVCGCPENFMAVNDSCAEIQRCTDGTNYGQCSKNKPLSCQEGVLKKKATQCGCVDLENYEMIGDDCRFISPQEKEDIRMSTTEQESKNAIIYINQLRKENGKREITWDKRAYLLGLARTKDMYTNKYMDHVSPSGQCTDNMKTQYGFTTEILPENAWGATRSYDEGGTYNYLSSKPNINSAIDSWMTSEGHRYNLLYDDHMGGAVSCYGSSCVFIGVQPGPYGLGAGGCHTAAEGKAYWENN